MTRIEIKMVPVSINLSIPSFRLPSTFQIPAHLCEDDLAAFTACLFIKFADSYNIDDVF